MSYQLRLHSRDYGMDQVILLMKHAGQYPITVSGPNKRSRLHSDQLHGGAYPLRISCNRSEWLLPTLPADSLRGRGDYRTRSDQRRAVLQRVHPIVD